MNKVILIVAVAFYLIGCQKVENKKAEISSEVSVLETDSLVVNNLIKQSAQYYKDNLVSAQSYDDYLKQATEIAERDGLFPQLAKIYNTVGIRYRNRSEYGSALTFHTKAVEIARKHADSKRLSNYINMLAVVYRRIDESNRALDLHMEAMKIAEAQNDTFQIGVALNGLGNVNLNLKRYHASIEYFKKSLALAISRQDLLGQAINSNNIGEALKNLGEVDSSMIYFNMSLDYNTQIDSKVGQAICFNSIGDAYRIKKEYKMALNYLQKSLELNIQSRDKINVATIYSSLGETYLEIKDYVNAIKNLKSGLSIAEDIGSKHQIENCSRLLAQVYEETNNLNASLNYYKLARNYKDSILSEENLRHINTTKAIYDLERSHSKIEQLNKETELQRLLIKQQKRAIIYFVFLLTVMIGAAVLLFWQIKLRASYNKILMQQRLLRTQMNPHFIFNALSAIQVYILENDMERSSIFLSDFASLMRQVLRSSEYEYVSLEEEKNMLKYYLDLQRLRFTKPFDYKLRVIDSLDATAILIPPMLTQPFVENAIEHGIKSIGDGGKVEVRFFSENDKLIVEIEDNGIGLKATQKANVGPKKHESMAIKITNERLEVIRKMTKKRSGIEIIDLKEVHPNKSGVLVRLELPIIKPNDRAIKAKSSIRIES